MRSISIAITDDFDLARTDLPRILSIYGVNTVFTAKHGKELLTKLNEGNIPELILLDIRMPVMDGFDTAKILKEKWPLIKILAYSTDQPAFVMPDILNAGAHGFIPKGTSPDKLVKAMFEVLDTGTYVSKEKS